MDNEQLVISKRREGKTYSEISQETGIAKGTISRVLKGVIFEQDVRNRILERQKEQKNRGLTKSKLSIEMKKKFSARNSLIDAKKVFEKNKNNRLFQAGLVLYWSHGSFANNYFQFSSGDSSKIIMMLDWLNKFGSIQGSDIKYRLYSPIFKQKEVLSYWGNIVGSINKIAITSYKMQNPSKNVENKGFLQILCYKVSLQNKLKYLVKFIIDEINNKAK